MLKSYRAVGGGWVAYKTLVSAPVPIWIGIRGLGLGLDNSVNFINRCCFATELRMYLNDDCFLVTMKTFLLAKF